MEKKKYIRPSSKVKEIKMEPLLVGSQDATGGDSGQGGFGAKSNNNSVEPETSSSWVNNDQSN